MEKKKQINYYRNSQEYYSKQNIGVMYNSAVLDFAESLELNLIESEEFENVVDGAILKCTGCPYQTTMLNVSSQSSVYIQGKLVATKKDKEPILNITPFPEICKYGGKCEPLIEEDWFDFGETMFIEGNEALTKKSKAKCFKGGLIEIEHTGQFPLSEQIAQYSENLMKIVSEGGDKEKIKQKMSEYLSKVYDEDVKVDDFKLLKGSREDTLDITLIGARQSNGYQGKDNRNLGIHEHIDEYNKNGVFFSEKKDITISRYLGSGGAKTEEVDERGAIVPIKGTIYSNSTEYYITSNLSERDLNYIKESWKLENKDKLLKLEKSLKENDEKIRRLKSSLKINGEKITISGLNMDAVLKKGKNGRIIATVSDNLNLLNKRENQLIIEQYRKAGIDIKNNLLSEIIVENNRQAMKQSSVNYDEEFIDGKEVESRGKFYTGTSVIGGQVVYAASAYRSENLKNSKISSSENTDEDSAFKGGYRKKPINEELHRKINERKEGEFYKKRKRVIDEDGAYKGGYTKNSKNEELHRNKNEREEGYYFKKQFKKIKLDIETKYKNIRAVNEINRGNLPENPVTEISRSINSRNTAKDFAIRLLGREPTMEEWMRGNKIKINGKICYNCWIASEKGRTVTYRPSGWASGRTSDNASSVDLNDNGVFKKFKFEQK